MAWFALITAGLFEAFAVTMINQLSRKRTWSTLGLIVLGLGLALGFLSYALQTIPMGTGYAIWTGISVVASSLIGMIYFGESKEWKRIFFIALILGSAMGLKLIS